jgi:DNA-binding beta-propeller fold protein YncE
LVRIETDSNGEVKGMSTHFFGLKDWTFQYSHSIGRNEFAGTGFRNAVDLALADDNVVYVLNRSYETRPDGVHVSVVTFDEHYISDFGSYGEGDGQFVWPTSIALDSRGNIHITDEWLNRISVFTKDGDFIRKWGKPGSGPGELDRPAGLTISEDDIIFMTDSRNHRVQKFTLDGEYLGHFGSFGSGPGQLNLPWGIALDKDNLVYVADWRNDRIQQFTPDGQWQATFGGKSGSGVGEFNRPNGVAVDKDGLIYVTDWLNNRVQILNRDGRFVTALYGDHQLSQWGKDKLLSNPDMIKQRAMAYSADLGAFEKHFRHPCAVKVDDQYRIAVIDHINGRIQVYVKRTTPVLV